MSAAAMSDARFAQIKRQVERSVHGPDLDELLAECERARSAEGARTLDRVAADEWMVVTESLRELLRARRKHPAMASPHHGYAVLLEELDELWTEIKTQTPDAERMREEAIQVAAMGMRFVLDLCGGAR